MEGKLEVTQVGNTLRVRIPQPYSSELKPVPLPKITKVSEKEPKSNVRTFQIIPHVNVKNDKTEQFAELIAESYEELFQRWAADGSGEPDRLFFETHITKDAFKTYLTANNEIPEMVEQHARLTWKDVTVREQDEDIVDTLNSDNCTIVNYKLKRPFFLSLKTDRTMQQIPLEELLETSRFMKDDDCLFIQFGIQSAEDSWYKDADKDREHFESKPPKRWGRRKLTRATDLKPTKYGFDFTLRVVAHSESERRKRQLLRGVFVAYKQLNDDNELLERYIKPSKAERYLKHVKERRITTPFIIGKRQLLSSAEVAHFAKLPQRTLQQDFPIIETVAGREVEVPKALTKGGIAFGDVTFKGVTKAVYMPTKDYDELCLPHVVIGGMGSGKTRGFGANWIVEAVRNGFGAIAIDPAKGEIGDEVTSALPEDKVIRIKMGEEPVALDWCEVEHVDNANNRLANTVIGFFNSTMDETGAQTSRYVRAAVLGMQTGKLSEILRIFQDEEYRKKVVEGMPDGLNKSTLLDFDKMSVNRQAQILAPIMNRLDAIMGDTYLGECMESDNSLDMVALLSQRKAVIIDVPKALLGVEVVNLIVNLLSTKIDLAMTLRKESDHFPSFVVFDEPHQYLKSASTWRSAVVESRKWRVGYVWMFHSFAQLPKDLIEIIKSANPHYHIYSTSKETYKHLAEEISPITVEEALKIKKHHAINLIRSGESVVNTPVIAKMSPPPSKRKIAPSD